MKVIDLLATNLNRRDDKSNQALAEEIIKGNQIDWIKDLVENLNHKDKNIQSDCIKVLYEVGEKGSPELIEPYINDFGRILNSKNNRLIWGAMIALDMIASINPKGVYVLLPEIVMAVDKGSVITIDHGVGILAKLSSNPECSKKTFPLLIEQLIKCPAKQLAMYAEKSIGAVTLTNHRQFIDLLESRIPELESESQKKRIEKVIKTLKNRPY